MATPIFDDHPGFLQRIENLAVEKFVAKLRVEAFAIAVFPRAARLDIGGLGADRAVQSWTALATNSGPLSERTCPGTPRIMNRSDGISMTSVELSFLLDRQAFPHELVDDVQLGY